MSNSALKVGGGAALKARELRTAGIKRALDLVDSGMALKTAATLCGVSHQSVRNKKTGISALGAKTGPPTILTADEENAIVDTLIHLSLSGISVGLQTLREKVAQVCSDGRAS